MREWDRVRSPATPNGAHFKTSELLISGILTEYFQTALNCSLFEPVESEAATKGGVVVYYSPVFCPFLALLLFIYFIWLDE
jgi:hypothetical protein